MTTATNPPALAVMCPVCRVQPGQPCRDPLGAITERHPNRHFAWDRAGRPHLSVPGATVDFPAPEGSAMTTTAATAIPDVPLPAGAEHGDTWEGPGPRRVIMGPDRRITDSDVYIWTSAIQQADGQIAPENPEPPQVHIEETGDVGLNSDQARELAAVLLEAAAVLDGWAARD